MRDYGGYRDKYAKYEAMGSWIQIAIFWEDTRPASNDKLRKNTINELPMQIPERAILMASNPGDVVLDCFTGGGSTLHAAEKNGRQWIGADLENCEASLQRIRAFLISEETPTPSKAVQDCFSAQFVKAALTIDPSKKNRPIKRARNVVDVSGDKFKSKSRIFAPAFNGAAHTEVI